MIDARPRIDRPDGKPMEQAKIHLMPDGAALHYRIRRSGPQARGLIVLLHGMASNLTRWSEFLERTSLKSEWDFLRPDLRGHGESFVRGKIGLEIWSEDLITLLDAEGCERAVLVGHSLGAHLALYFAARFPARVQGVVMIDPVFFAALHGRLRVLATLRPLLYVAVALIRLLNALGLRRRTIPLRDLRALDEQVRAELLEAGNAR
jgi:pimeloyl-ACP methyl ester carboxylesterase